MKLLTLLVLCSRLLPSLTEEKQPQQIDCNDEDLFQAVDTALQKYNSEIQSGNQFMLDRVTEGTKMVRDRLTVKSRATRALWRGGGGGVS